MFNIEELKLSEVADIERLSGKPLAALGDSEVPRGKLLQAIVYVINRRDNPKYKFEDAGEVSMKDATSLIVGEDDDTKSSDEGEG